MSRSSRAHRLFIVLASGALLGAGAPPPLTLFDFKARFDRKLLSTSDAEASLTPAGALSIRTGHRTEWPGATLKAPAGKWDLSRFAFVECEVLNHGAAPAEIHCRVDNPGADGTRHCLSGKIALAPGAKGKLRVPLS